MISGPKGQGGAVLARQAYSHSASDGNRGSSPGFIVFTPALNDRASSHVTPVTGIFPPRAGQGGLHGLPQHLATALRCRLSQKAK